MTDSYFIFCRIHTDKMAHEEEKKFKCFTCDTKFSQPKALIEHISTAHVVEKSLNDKKKYENKKPDKIIQQKSNIYEKNNLMVNEELIDLVDEETNSKISTNFKSQQELDEGIVSIQEGIKPTNPSQEKTDPEEVKSIEDIAQTCRNCKRNFLFMIFKKL